MPCELRLNISSPDMAAKNLRSKKGCEAGNDLAEDNLEQIRLLIASLTDTIDKLDADSRKRHDAIYGKLENVEERTKTLFKDVGEMKTSLDFVNREVEDLKQRLEDKADKSSVAKLMAKIEDLENRSKRNNVVFWNIPEGTEDGSTCEGINNICYLPGGRSVWEKTVPEVLSTARGRRPRAVLKTKGTVFSHTDRPSPVNNIFIFFLQYIGFTEY